jgi:hypothetical protein
VRRLLPLGVVALALVGSLAACGGRPVVLPSPSPTFASPSPSPVPTSSPTAAPSPSPTVTVSPAPELDLPRDAPTALAAPEDPDALARDGYRPLLPPGAASLDARVTSGALTRIAVTWYRGEDPFARQSGLVIWQRFPDAPAWRAVFAFTDRPADGVLGISLEQEDLTRDGVPDLLVREDAGGTGACARWRVLASAPGRADEVWRHEACDTDVRIVRGRLLVREAVFRPEDPHCCPSAMRVRTFSFDGTAFVQTRNELVDLQP